MEVAPQDSVALTSTWGTDMVVVERRAAGRRRITTEIDPSKAGYEPKKVVQPPSGRIPGEQLLLAHETTVDRDTVLSSDFAALYERHKK